MAELTITWFSGFYVHGLTGSKVEKVCEAASISLNRNTVPGDASALSPGGVPHRGPRDDQGQSCFGSTGRLQFSHQSEGTV